MRALTEGMQEGSIGNQCVIVPAGSPSVNGQGSPLTAVKFKGQSNDPRSLVASVYAYPQNGNAAGPVVGVAKWGAGYGVMHEAEFDIPVAENTSPVLNPPVNPQRGGVILNVMGTSLEIWARDDANLIPPPIVAKANTAIGDGGTAATEPVVVGAAVGVGSINSNARVTRTIWLIHASAANALAIGDAGTVNVPPFATSFRVLRSNNSVGSTAGAFNVAIGLNQGIGIDGGYNIAAGIVCPEIAISGQSSTVTVLNNGAVALERVAVIFYLGL